MTNTKMVELLRETRRWVGHNLDCTSVCDECVLAARIDAALATHDAAPPSEERVEWRLANRPHVFLAHLNDADMALRVDWDRWYWKVTREGHTTTLDEAKAAAIEAARGMR